MKYNRLMEMRRRGNKSRIPAYTPIRIHIHTDTYVYVYRQKMHVDIHEERVYIESIEYAEKEREGILKCFWRTVADKNRLAHCERGRARGRIKMHGARVIVSLCLIRMELGGEAERIRFDSIARARPHAPSAEKWENARARGELVLYSECVRRYLRS